MTNGILTAAVILGLSTAAAVAQDVAAGETSFKKCLARHTIGEGAKNKVGPVLNGLDGRKSGTVTGRCGTSASATIRAWTHYRQPAAVRPIPLRSR